LSEIEYIDDDREPTDAKYLDAVLDMETRYCLANGSPEHIVKWLEGHSPQATWRVYRGITKVGHPVESYLAAYYEGLESKRTERHAKITEIVTRAMAAQAKATYHSDSVGELDIVAKNAADEIVKLFD
jgi:hypothetical protein